MRIRLHFSTHIIIYYSYRHIKLPGKSGYCSGHRHSYCRKRRRGYIITCIRQSTLLFYCNTMGPALAKHIILSNCGRVSFFLKSTIRLTFWCLNTKRKTQRCIFKASVSYRINRYILLWKKVHIIKSYYIQSLRYLLSIYYYMHHYLQFSTNLKKSICIYNNATRYFTELLINN